MAYPISPDYNHQVGYQLVSIPQYGKLIRDGIALHVGERFSERDILAGTVCYQQTENLPTGATSVDDSFSFQLFDRGLLVQDALLYSVCLPTPEVTVPADGVYTFTITIRATPTPIGVAKGFSLKQSSTRPLTNLDLNIAGPASRTDQIVHTVVGPPTQGVMLVNGRPAQQFTQQDVDTGRVSYQHTGGLADDSIRIKSCNQFSKCVSNTLPVSFAPTVHFTGPNLFYARTGTKWQTSLTASSDLLLWDLIGASEGPPLSPEAIGVVYWTYYDNNYNGALDSSSRGAGYDKLPLYRNIPLKYQWGGGLPLGVYLDNMAGLVSTASRLPYNQASDNTWVTPLVPGEFTWRVMITDPYTGENAVRDYTLRVTEDGFGPRGQISETV